MTIMMARTAKQQRTNDETNLEIAKLRDGYSTHKMVLVKDNFGARISKGKQYKCNVCGSIKGTLFGEVDNLTCTDDKIRNYTTDPWNTLELWVDLPWMVQASNLKIFLFDNVGDMLLDVCELWIKYKQGEIKNG